MSPRTTLHAFNQGLRDVLSLTVGVVPFGLITGITAIGMGFSPVDTIGMTLLFFSGSAQMVVMQLMQEAALPITLIVTALVINLRFLMYSAVVAPSLGRLPRRHAWPLAFLLSDQAFALNAVRLGTDKPDPCAFPYYAGTAVMLWLGWNLAVTAGLFLGTGIPEHWSLGFTIPLSFLALLIPNLRTSPMIGAAVVGGTLAVLCIDLPYNAGLLVASLGGVITGLGLERTRMPCSPDTAHASTQEDV
ncbi:AzlC family ABC transporter permease [Pseudomonas sp. 22-AL-CL-001]|uniref:AzlC family ABC transporter permease n=1 Tax=Pseudomonas alabamensis TaxID=3064349 RepID=UPI0027126619|nr:AzlC family ABC transporter permease [Pseudomonas sp. 22-AL-CL-001]MDO7912458.1 AzlC family ABC transporter permease [Pseudomonas sp. 22-AL-CL-001]